MTASPLSLFEKIWNAHVVQDLGHGWALLHVDRHLLHELSGTTGLNALSARGLQVRTPELNFATFDHVVSTAPGRTGRTFKGGSHLYDGLKDRATAAGIRYFDLGRPGHGIVHVIGPELGLVLPGSTVVCGDSHTCTNGALGALAFGIGSSESTHALATQTVRQRRPKTMRISLRGLRQPSVTAKDIALHVIRTLGAAAGSGFAVEYAGSAVESMIIEERLTLCNMSIEMGAKFGIIAPDEATFEYLRDAPFSPQGTQFESAVATWRALRSDDDCVFDQEVTLDVADVRPSITWGTSPDQNAAINERVPSPEDFATAAQRDACQKALAYMDLKPGTPLSGLRIDRVFIGSCTNSRLSDLRAAAAVVKGRKVASHVRAWVVPGSENVKLAAEAEGLAGIFRDAGFEWREPGCSMCVAANGETAAPGSRVVSTSNRNFVGRQGPGVRTHLASPATAATSAIAGSICAGEVS